MNIYIASSWRNQHGVELLTDKLEQLGMTVHSFIRQASETEGQVNFGKDESTDWLNSQEAREKFIWDYEHASNADLIVYLGPSGIDAWSEVAVGWNNGVPILALWAKGEQVGIARHMVTTWFHDVKDLIQDIVQRSRALC